MASDLETHQTFSPRQALAGPGASHRVGDVLNSWGLEAGSTVSVVVDPDVHALGLCAAVERALAEAGYTAILIPTERGEPQISWVEQIVADVRSARPAACIGIGGGSAMDVAKLAAALITNPGQIEDYLGAGKVSKESIPTVMIPTTAGTGSEATQVAMLSRAGMKVVVASPSLIPRAAILDPDLTVLLPQHVTAASGLDAFAHAVESYLSTRANQLTMGASLYGAELVANSLQRTVRDPSAIGDRMNMLTGAYWSGVGLNANVILGHSIAYTIANRTNLAHGVTCAMALPYCLAYNEQGSESRIQDLSSMLARQPATQGSVDIYGWLNDVADGMAIPRSLKEVGLSRRDIPGMVDECVGSYPRPNNPVPLEADPLRLLYSHLLEGDAAGYMDAVHKSNQRKKS